MSDEPMAWERNAYAFHVDPAVAEMYMAVNDYASRLMRDSLDRHLNPWKGNDRNPMPTFDWWPWVDRWLALRTEIPARVRGAINVLRYGVPPDQDDW